MQTVTLPLLSFIYRIKCNVLIWANPESWQPTQGWMAGHCMREKGTNPRDRTQRYVRENLK